MGKKKYPKDFLLSLADMPQCRIQPNLPMNVRVSVEKVCRNHVYHSLSGCFWSKYHKRLVRLKTLLADISINVFNFFFKTLAHTFMKISEICLDGVRNIRYNF